MSQPYSETPYSQQPYSQQPYSQQPYSQQPYSQQPYSQQQQPYYQPPQIVQPQYGQQSLYQPMPQQYGQPQPQPQSQPQPPQYVQPQQTTIYAQPQPIQQTQYQTTNVQYQTLPQNQISTKARPNDRFKPMDGARDVVWALLFVVHIILMICLCIYYAKKSNDIAVRTVNFNGKVWGMLIMILIESGILSYLFLIFVKSNSKIFIQFSLGVSVVGFIVLAIIMFAVQSIPFAIIFIVLALLNVIYWILVRRRIAFSAEMLSMSVQCIQNFPATLYTAVGSLPFHAIWTIIWVVTTVSVLNVMRDVNDDNSKQNFAYFLLVLSYYWTSQVIKNVVHATVSGVFGSWYFLAPNNMPPNPTSGALKRATTTSFGSICLGSFVIALIKAVRSFIQNMARDSRNDFFRCLVLCLLHYLERIFLYINHYAFTYVAIYGTTYCEGAQNTWELILSRGFDMLINDNLIDGALLLGSLLVGCLSALIATLLAKIAFDVELWGMWVVIGFFIGFTMALLGAAVVESCVASCFVCFAEDPEALQRTKPELYQRLSDAMNGRLTVLRVERQGQVNVGNV